MGEGAITSYFFSLCKQSGIYGGVFLLTPEPSLMSLRQSEHNPVDPSLTNGIVPQSACIHLDFHDEKTETSTCPLNLEFITCGSAQCLHAVQL